MKKVEDNHYRSSEQGHLYKLYIIIYLKMEEWTIVLAAGLRGQTSLEKRSPEKRFPEKRSNVKKSPKKRTSAFSKRLLILDSNFHDAFSKKKITEYKCCIFLWVASQYLEQPNV